MAFLLALLAGTVVNAVMVGLLASIGTLDRVQEGTRFEVPVLVCACSAAGLFGPWLRRRDNSAWRRAVLSGIACPLVTFVVVGAAVVYGARTERAFAQGLGFGSLAYFDFIFEGLGPVHLVQEALLGIVGLIAVGSAGTLFVPEIVGGFAGHMLWEAAGADAGRAEAKPWPGPVI